MTEAIEPLCREWHKEWEQTFADGVKAEALAAKHPNIPFRCELELDRSHPQIAWRACGISIQEFSQRVKLVASVFGLPDKVDGTNWSGATGAPPLIATWRCDGVWIEVAAYSATGCKLDPRFAYHKGESSQIHPECVAVLKELEDAGEDES